MKNTRLMMTQPMGGSQGDIYQIAETVKELNAIYQVGLGVMWVHGRALLQRRGGCRVWVGQRVAPPSSAAVAGACARAVAERSPLQPPSKPPPPPPPQLVARYYMKFTGMSGDEVERATNRDTFMTPEEAQQARARERGRGEAARAACCTRLPMRPAAAPLRRRAPRAAR